MSIREEILTLNTQRSSDFCTPSARDSRVLYSQRQPTEILVFKCMDGRINLPLITGVPMGILHPFRNMGGKFVLGDPYLGRLVLDSKEDALSVGHFTLALCTYHFSKGNAHRGCAGHDYATEKARQAAITLKTEFGEVFGEDNPTISAIVIGIETDDDALVFCNREGSDLSVGDLLGSSDEEVKTILFSHFPEVPKKILCDLLPLALGNRNHVELIRKHDRPVQELAHNENIIAVGRGFDWLHLINRALIIGPYGHTDGTWREAVSVAGKIVLGNFNNNPTLKKDGALLLVSAPYKNLGERGIAMAKARYFEYVAKQALEGVALDLSLDTLVGVTDMTTMKFHSL